VWTDHFRLVSARIEPLTPTGRVTVRLLQLNQPDRIEERKLLVSLGAFSPPGSAVGESSSSDALPPSETKEAAQDGADTSSG
jgi:hypothetical protein